MNFLCPACRTPLPVTPALSVVPCARCGVEVDLTRVDTAPGAARLWPDVDLSGERLGGYQLGGRIGAGGMGAVYEAQGPQGPCAVKVLSALLAAEPGLRARFRREAAALRAIAHEGVVRISAEGEERGFCWYAMERVSGPDLRARIAQARLSAAEVIALARQLLSALKVVHAAGFVHRDVKPGNILLAAGGPKLCDFGIARFDGSTTLTESAAMMGSLRYMSPEQRLGRADARSDLYALGVVLHECLAGGVPGEADLPAGVPRRLRRLIVALLADRPEHRPANAGAALARLEEQRGKLAISAAALVGFAALAAVARWGPGLFEAGPPQALTLEASQPVSTAKLAGPAQAKVAGPGQSSEPSVAPVHPGVSERAIKELRQAFASRRTRRAATGRGGRLTLKASSGKLEPSRKLPESKKQPLQRE